MFQSQTALCRPQRPTHREDGKENPHEEHLSYIEMLYFQ